MKIVGVGCGPKMMTEAAIFAVQSATLIYGSDRAIALAAAYIPEECEVHTITDYKALRSLPDETVILSTGDPMLAGLGYLEGEVVPGISSLSYAAAQMHLPLTRVVLVNAHGKDHKTAREEAVSLVKAGRIAVVIADPAFSVEALANALETAGQRCSVTVCENLGYPDERITTGTSEIPPVPAGDLFIVVAGTW